MRNKQDKIIDNNYNSGNIEFNPNSRLEIDDMYSNDNLDDVYNSEQYYEKKAIMELMYTTYQSNIDTSEYDNKKFTKSSIPNIYTLLFDVITAEHYLSSVQKFCYIAEFIDVSYRKIWESIEIKYKEEILVELKKTNDVFTKYGQHNISKLF